MTRRTQQYRLPPPFAPGPVVVERKPRAGSLISRISALLPGECTSHIVHARTEDDVREVLADGPRVRNRMRNSVMSSARAAAGKTGMTYTISVMNILGQSTGAIYTLAIVTRN